jgi:hypothetical protein
MCAGNNTDASFLQGQKFSISCINCNSLNMSNSAKWNQSVKIYGITVSAKDDVSRVFLNNPYEKYNFYANSSKNKRGVAILINSSLSAAIDQQWSDNDENILALRIRIQGNTVLFVSIYWPNTTDLQFFNTLNDILLANRILLRYNQLLIQSTLRYNQSAYNQSLLSQ